MPHGIFNWTFNDVVRFLKDHNFSLNHIEGSHYFYIGSYKGIFRQVCVPFHGIKSINSKTIKGIIRQFGIPKEEWLRKK